MLHRLENFYANPIVFARVQSILQGDSKLSLRLIDWFVTNYSKKQNVSFLTKDNKHVIVYLVYKAHLKAYNKKMFDPFCRWKRIQFRAPRAVPLRHQVGAPSRCPRCGLV